MKNLFKNETKENSYIEHSYKINGKDWVVDESMSFKVQSSSENIRIYGYTLEFRYPYNSQGIETWTQWYTYCTNKIYNSPTSASQAGIQSSKIFKGSEWRIMPLYVMDQQQFRDFKINRLFNDGKDESKYEIKGWKVKDDIDDGEGFQYRKNTLFIQLENGTIIYLSNKTDKTKYDYRHHLKKLIDNKEVDEVNIKDEKWAYPHLLKELKLKLNNTI